MSTMELETHILSQFRALPQSIRVQVAEYIEFMTFKHAPKEEPVTQIDWLKLAEPSFEFWDNELDAEYDSL